VWVKKAALFYILQEKGNFFYETSKLRQPIIFSLYSQSQEDKKGDLRCGVGCTFDSSVVKDGDALLHVLWSEGVPH
jgi:hypothetical protein